ncbi:antibiotic biosynthesis monooxygenase [Niallia circulans]|uniref:Antibiotic biosynthesis monooxygenase n=1 Tax=Niallia circulans TaxID=1397 RepID=A0A553STJ1_NIACI|nr:antibiotic biosynthesis monooxygenase family protein [Niallia circulans]TRZ40281.1 antibiotic biosynthesis monooxygenase [Niallia circulans]
MIIQLVENTVKPGKKEEYIKNAKEFCKANKENVDGCLGAYVLTDSEKEDSVYIVNVWESQERMGSEKAGGIFLKHKASLKPYFVKNETTLLELV